MYRASAALSRSIADKYGIPKDRNHIIGHIEVPGATHTDPGPCWDWTDYVSLVNPTWSTVPAAGQRLGDHCRQPLEQRAGYVIADAFKIVKR